MRRWLFFVSSSSLWIRVALLIISLTQPQCTNVVDGAAAADGTHRRHRDSDNYAGQLMRQASSPADDEGDTPVIINGQKVANRNLAPWMVYLEALNSGICGGSLITNQVTLTAAHCVTSRCYNRSADQSQFSFLHHRRTDFLIRG
ncbi:unnamed protein product, partial [Notodromas monacha]